MLEDLFGQLVDLMASQGQAKDAAPGAAPSSAPAPNVNFKLSAAESLAVVKHIFEHGAIASLSGDPKTDKQPLVMMVLRNAARKDVRPVFGKLIGAALAGSK